MAYCRNCGTKLSDTAIFCKECGLKVNDEQMSSEMAWFLGAQEKIKDGFEKLIDKFKSDKRYAIFTGACAVLFVVGFILYSVLSGMSKKIDLEECFNVSFYGYDSIGYAEVYLDENMLMSKIRDTVSEKKYNEISFYELVNCINYKLDQYDGLSNGDTIKLEVNSDNERAEQYKIKFTENVYDFEVSGLEELKRIDPFEDLTVSFEGISPHMNLDYEYNGDDGYLYSGMFSADKYEDISIGDVVTITLECDENEAVSSGYHITQTVKEYECTQGAVYVESIARVPEMDLQNMINDAQDCVKSFYAGNSEYISCTELGYAGAYLLFTKNEDTYYNNILYIVCFGKVSSREKNDRNKSYFAAQQVFMPIGFKDVILQADGSLSYDMISADIMGSTELSYNNGWYDVPGYQKQGRMYNELVGGELVNYTYEVSGSLQDLDGTSIWEGPEGAGDDLENDDYIFDNSDSSYLSIEDIESLSDDELRLARNEIYARHGRIFQDEWLRNYFSKKSWYNGTTQEVAESELNEYEIANRDLIVEEENRRN